MLKTCCLTLSLRTGAVIVGILIYPVILLPWMLLQLWLTNEYELSREPVKAVLKVFGIIFSGLCIIQGLLLVFGVVKDSAPEVALWCIFAILRVIVFNIVLLISYDSVIIYIGIFLISIPYTALEIYFFVVVCSCFLEMNAAANVDADDNSEGN